MQGVRDNKIWSSYDNIIRDRFFSTDIYMQINPWKGGQFSVNGSIDYDWYKNPNAQLSLGGWNGAYFIDYNQNLFWKLKLNFFHGGNFGRNIDDVYSLGGHWHSEFIGLQRSFLKNDRLTVMLGANQPFERHSLWKERIIQGSYTGKTSSRHGNQQFGIRVTYRFGSLKAQVKTADRSISNDDVVGGLSTSAGNNGNGQQGGGQGGQR